MVRRALLPMVVLSLALAVPVLAKSDADSPAANNNCKMKDVAGSYTRVSQYDVGNGPEYYIFQLNLNRDGTATQNWTGLPEMMLTLGSGTPEVGSWTCKNGHVVLTMISSTYVPVESQDPFTNAPDVDLTLLRHNRVTSRLNVLDQDTLVRTKAINRTYDPNEDPSDPNGGTLGTLNTTQLTYTRLVASDADLH